MKGKKQYARWIVLAGIVLLALLCMAKYAFAYLNTLVFTERQRQLREVVSPYFEKIDTVTDELWQTAETLENRVISQNLTDTAELQALFEQESAIQNWDDRGISPIAIRDDGQYLDKDGVHGSLGYIEPLRNCGRRTSFIFEQPMTGKLFNLYVYRLEEPIRVAHGGDLHAVAFVGIVREMEAMNPYFKCSAYGNDNSTYILDRYGAKQYVDSSASMNLIEGHNVYGVLRKEYEAQGRDFDAVLDELNRTGTAYSDVEIEGQQCFYAMRKMPNTDYVILYINPADRVATSTAELVNLVVQVFLFASVGIFLAVVVLIIFIVRRNRKQLAEELQAKHDLEELNDRLGEAVKVAEKATKAKSEFLSNMSHDIRTPMNAIVGITDLMAHEADTSDKMHTYIEKVRMSSRHLLSLINDILDMSKIESSEVALNQDSISLAEQIGQVDSIIRSQTNERGQTFCIRVHTIAHEYLIGDGVRLRQIFINLLSNAVKYTPYGGKIDFDFAELPCDVPDHATYRITVEDNGYGMTPEFVRHIFEPFTRAENSMTNKVQGTGLGMAITKNIVDLMGGTITVQSEVNKGSRFEVTLTFPIDDNADMRTDLGAAVLISDDEVLRGNIAAAMREVNVRFRAVSTKEEAAKLMETQKIDIVLVGGHLTDTGLAERVAFIRRAAKGPILIFFVDYVQPEEIEGVVAACGIDGLIPRPFFLSNLLRSIERIKNAGALEEERGSALKGKHFLCAEDNGLNAEILEAILDMNGAKCTIYPNGEKLVNAFATVQPGDYDAILMDVQMPVMNGLEATRAIRGGENPLGRTIPIIAMTANAFTEDIQQCLDAGMDAHVSKPLDVAVLERTLRGVASGNFSGGGTLVCPKKT